MTITPAMWISFCLISFVLGFLIGFVILLRKSKHKERVFDIKTEMEADAETEADVDVEVDDTTFNVLSAKEAQIKTEEAMSAIKLSLRCSPDRIIFGEIRDGDVLWSLLDGFNTGHPGGISTIHANSAQGTLKRMKTLLTQAHKPDVPVDGLIDLIVHLSRSEDTGVVVDEILETNNHELY